MNGSHFRGIIKVACVVITDNVNQMVDLDENCIARLAVDK